MPRGDGTGPMGMGPMTGRAAGYCTGFGIPDFMNSIPGRGFGMGFGGRGCGWRHRFYATGLPGWMRSGAFPSPMNPQAMSDKPDPEMEKQTLKNQFDVLQAQLDIVKKRLDDLEGSSESQ